MPTREAARTSETHRKASRFGREVKHYGRCMGMSDVMSRIWAGLTLVALSAHERLRSEKGQAATEYVMLLVVIIAIAGAVLGTSSTGFFKKLADKATGLIP